MATYTAKQVQDRLVELGYDVGPDGADGVFGKNTQTALLRFQSNHGLAPTGQPDQATAAKLFPPKPKRTFSMNIGSNWISGIVGSTAFKYLVAMVATFIASKIGLDQGSVEGIITQLVAVAMAVWGMFSASQSKAVVNGQVTLLKDMAVSDQKAVVDAVADAKGVAPSTLTK